jgi:mRNA interferase HicA
LHRGREYNRGTGCGKTARPGLYGGCRVTGIPTVEVAETRRLLTVYTYPCTVKPMKRRDLERALRQLGWYFLRHGGKHDVWTNGKREEAIPRHTEIHDKLAQAILRRVKGSS